MSTIHICLCFDGNINKQALLTAFSVANASSDTVVAHFVCFEKEAQKFRLELDALMARMHGRQVKFFIPEIHTVADDIVDAIPKHGWLPKAACLRLFLASILPIEIQRVIYLDCDILVAADLGELYRMDLHGCPIAAVQDERMRPFFCVEIGLDARHYFNSGMLIIDLAQWDEPARRALDLFVENGAAYPCLDQDVLNIVFKDNWLELETRWNTTTNLHPFASRWFELVWPDGWKNENFPPAVYHLTPAKPWVLCCPSRVRFTYRRLARELFEGGIPINRAAPFVFMALSWMPRPFYRMAFWLRDTQLAFKHVIGRARIRPFRK